MQGVGKTYALLDFGKKRYENVAYISFDTSKTANAAFDEDVMRQYLVVSGMPEAVSKFTDTKDYKLIRLTQSSIVSGYLGDMSKYSTLIETRKTRAVYNNLTVQFLKQTRGFNIS